MLQNPVRPQSENVESEKNFKTLFEKPVLLNRERNIARQEQHLNGNAERE